MDSINEAMVYFETYGLWFMFIIVYLEYLNLPGLPAGVIMPAIGALIANSKYNFLFVLIISVIAGILGSICLYYVGYFIGNPTLNWIYSKFPKTRRAVDKVTMYCEKFGNKGIFICRLVPVARTLVSLTVGTLRDGWLKFILCSVPGITIWNAVTIMSGYLASKAIMSF